MAIKNKKVGHSNKLIVPAKSKGLSVHSAIMQVKANKQTKKEQGGRVLNPYTAGQHIGGITTYPPTVQYPPEYDLGGTISGLGGLANFIPGVGPIIGAAMKLGGGMLSGFQADKDKQEMLDLQRQKAGVDSANAGQASIKNDYTPTFSKGGIHIKKANRGKFTAYKERTGKTTAEALHSSNPHVRQMANFARNAKKWHHKADGGFIGVQDYINNMLAEGGYTGEPDNPYTFGPATSASVVNSIERRRMAPAEIAPHAINDGLFNGDVNQFMAMSSDQMAATLNQPDKGYATTQNPKVSSSNPGGFVYWRNDTIPAQKPSKAMDMNRKQYQYAMNHNNYQPTYSWGGRIPETMTGGFGPSGLTLGRVPGYESEGGMIPGKGFNYMTKRSSGEIKNWSKDTMTNVRYPLHYADGGEVQDYDGQETSPVQLEKQEVYQTPEGQMGQVNGPSHAQGGVNMGLPENSFVWSDKLKSHTGKTFADEASKLAKMKAKYEKILKG
jgi:hypothetical protein